MRYRSRIGFFRSEMTVNKAGNKSVCIDDIAAVVIGASAGGVEALSVILPALRKGSRSAIFIVVHLPKDRPSILPALFAERCALAVREAVNGEPIEAETIYFAPPDYHLLLDDGFCISLSIDEPINYSRPSIDVLFETAADLYGPRLLGILLSGGNDDGAQGLFYIQQCGGHTIVQLPESARVTQMPEAALSRMNPEAVLTLPQIAEVLSALARRDQSDFSS